jgi:hypothetical protein
LVGPRRLPRRPSTHLGQLDAHQQQENRNELISPGSIRRPSKARSNSRAHPLRAKSWPLIDNLRINRNRHSETSATEQKKDLTAKRSGIASIDDVQETATSLWIHEQLNRIRELLVEHGADDEMLDAVDYLVDDNKGWINPEIAEALGSTGTREA